MQIPGGGVKERVNGRSNGPAVPAVCPLYALCPLCRRQWWCHHVSNCLVAQSVREYSEGCATARHEMRRKSAHLLARKRECSLDGLLALCIGQLLADDKDALAIRSQVV